MLRYFQNKSLAEVGAAIGANEDTARMRDKSRTGKAAEILHKKRNRADCHRHRRRRLGKFPCKPRRLEWPQNIPAVLGKGAGNDNRNNNTRKYNRENHDLAKHEIGDCHHRGRPAPVGVAAIVAVSQTQPGGQSKAAEVHKKAQAAYASLSSYSDDGTYFFASDPMTVTATFSVKLARPYLYRIQYARLNTFSSDNNILTNQGVVWSAGNGDFQVEGG